MTYNSIKGDMHTPLTEDTEETEDTGETQEHAIPLKENSSPSALLAPGSTTQDHAKIEILNLWDDECPSDTQVDTDQRDIIAQWLLDKVTEECFSEYNPEWEPTLTDCKECVDLVIACGSEEGLSPEWGSLNWMLDATYEEFLVKCEQCKTEFSKPTGGIEEIDLSDF